MKTTSRLAIFPSKLPMEMRIMESLRRRGWLISLKCIPTGQGWIAEGSRSEYDAPSPDRVISRKRWSCEAMYLGHDGYPGSPWSTGKSALNVLVLIEAQAESMLRRMKARLRASRKAGK